MLLLGSIDVTCVTTWEHRRCDMCYYLGKHAFCVAAPRACNEFPIILKSSESITTFSKKHIFRVAF